MLGVFFSENIVSDIMLLIGWIICVCDVYVGDYDLKGFDFLLIFGMFDVLLFSFLVVVKDELFVSDSYVLWDMLCDVGGEVEFYEEENLLYVWIFYYGKFV